MPRAGPSFFFSYKSHEFRVNCIFKNSTQCSSEYAFFVETIRFQSIRFQCIKKLKYFVSPTVTHEITTITFKTHKQTHPPIVFSWTEIWTVFHWHNQFIIKTGSLAFVSQCKMLWNVNRKFYELQNVHSYKNALRRLKLWNTKRK